MKNVKCSISWGITIMFAIVLVISMIIGSNDYRNNEAHIELSMYGTLELSSGIMILKYDVPLDRAAYNRLDRLSRLYEVYVIDYTIGGDNGN